jgi:hypothetical protein
MLCWKKRSKNQSPADLPEHTLPTLFINSQLNSLTTKSSVKIRLSNNFHQVLGDLFGYWSTPARETGKPVRLFQYNAEI